LSAIIFNKVFKPGESHTFDYYPQLQVLSIIGFTDVVLHSNIDCYFYKSFKYSLDGVNFTDVPLELTDINLQNIPFQLKSILVLRITYERRGIDNSSLLTLSSFVLDNTVELLDNGFYFTNSLFSTFFNQNDEKVLSWAVNVLQKLYAPGIVPEYIERGKEKNENGEDEDYIAYWFSITHFFALFVIYSRIFKDIKLYFSTLKEYLLEKGILLNEDSSLEQLQELMKNFYNEISRRGTNLMLFKKPYAEDGVHGEILRLISFKYGDEFIFSLTPKHRIGWNLGKSSPIYKGVSDANNVIKGYELDSTKDLLPQYPISINSNITEELDGDNKVLDLSSGDVIGDIDILDIDNPYLLTYDSNLDYSIEFYYRPKDTSNDLNIKLKFFDSDLIPFSNATRKTKKAVLITTDSFAHSPIILSRTDIYYKIKCIIYNKSELNFKEKLNVSSGNNLKINDINPKYFIPLISGNGYLYGLKIKPLRSNYSLGFIHSNHLIQCWIKNNSKQLSKNNIKIILEDLFRPYNSWIKVNLIGDNFYQEEPFKNYWVAGEQECEIVDVFWIGDESTTKCELSGENNTGIKIYTLLSQVYYLDGVLYYTGVTKDNDYLDSDYVPPIEDLTVCPLRRSTLWIPDESTAICIEDDTPPPPEEYNPILTSVTYSDLDDSFTAVFNLNTPPLSPVSVILQYSYDEITWISDNGSVISPKVIFISGATFPIYFRIIVVFAGGVYSNESNTIEVNYTEIAGTIRLENNLNLSTLSINRFFKSGINIYTGPAINNGEFKDIPIPNINSNSLYGIRIVGNTLPVAPLCAINLIRASSIIKTTYIDGSNGDKFFDSNVVLNDGDIISIDYDL
jgi:hypothetical protein